MYCAFSELPGIVDATPGEAFRYVTLPLIMPGVVAGALMARKLSIDGFAITFFTAGTGPLPLQICSIITVAVPPEVKAVPTRFLLLTLASIIIASGRSPALLGVDPKNP